MMGIFLRFLCRIGWHHNILVRGFNGASLDGKCEDCGKELMQDSQGGWF